MDMHSDQNIRGTDFERRVFISGVLEVGGVEIGASSLSCGFAVDGAVGGMFFMWEIAIIEDKIIIEGDSWGRVDVVDPGNIYLPIFWDVEHGAGTAAYRSGSGAIIHLLT